MEAVGLISSEKFKLLRARFFALLIDSFFFVLFVYLESFVIVPEIPAAIMIAGIATYFLCTHFYSIYLHAVYGQTIGKMLMKIKVLDINEYPIGLKKAVLRESVWIVFSLAFFFSDVYQIFYYGITENFRNTLLDNSLLIIFTLWLIAEVIVALMNEKSRTIHDFIAKTLVVRLG
jgi:uncharacterized RDD family membrane protein YckC